MHDTKILDLTHGGEQVWPLTFGLVLTAPSDYHLRNNTLRCRGVTIFGNFKVEGPWLTFNYTPERCKVDIYVSSGLLCACNGWHWKSHLYRGESALQCRAGG